MTWFMCLSSYYDQHTTVLRKKWFKSKIGRKKIMFAKKKLDAEGKSDARLDQKLIFFCLALFVGTSLND